MQSILSLRSISPKTVIKTTVIAMTHWKGSTLLSHSLQHVYSYTFVDVGYVPYIPTIRKNGDFNYLK